MYQKLRSMKNNASINHKPSQFLAFALLSLFALASAGILHFSGSTAFQRFFGKINPLLAVFFVALAGVLAFSVLLRRGWFAIYNRDRLRRGLLTAAALATPLGVLIILVDLAGVFPADINVPFPDSLLFYPAIGFVVEIIFHVLPLTLLLLILTSLSRKLVFEEIIWPCMLLIAVAEPVFQAVLSASDHYPLWADLYVGFHIFLINLIQLWLFKGYGFVSMYAFRLAYYLIWHIGWGWLRLEVLF